MAWKDKNLPRTRISRYSQTQDFHLGGWGALLIVIAYLVFGYTWVWYKYAPDYLYPSMLFTFLLTIGLVIGKIMGYRIVLTRFDFEIIGLGILIAISMIAIEVLINIIFMRMSSEQAFSVLAGFTLIVSPIFQCLWYFSGGIAEESFFNLLIFNMFIKSTKSLGIALMVRTVFFTIYHLCVINVLYFGKIYSSLPYVTMIILAGMLFSLAFYYTKSFAVPALAHGLTNFIVTAISLGLIKI